MILQCLRGILALLYDWHAGGKSHESGKGDVSLAYSGVTREFWFDYYAVRRLYTSRGSESSPLSS